MSKQRGMSHMKSELTDASKELLQKMAAVAANAGFALISCELGQAAKTGEVTQKHLDNALNVAREECRPDLVIRLNEVIASRRELGLPVPAGASADYSLGWAYGDWHISKGGALFADAPGVWPEAKAVGFWDRLTAARNAGQPNPAVA